MLATIPLVHGLGAKSLAACLGTAASLAITAWLASIFTSLAHLSGVSTDETAFLSATTTNLSLHGLLLAGILIAALGVLNDSTVSQSSTVMALRRANPTLGFRRLTPRSPRRRPGPHRRHGQHPRPRLRRRLPPDPADLLDRPNPSLGRDNSEGVATEIVAIPRRLDRPHPRRPHHHRPRRHTRNPRPRRLTRRHTRPRSLSPDQL